MNPPSGRVGDGRGEARHPDTELGAYLLAALGPDDEAALERHLAHCASCQDRLLELSEVLPALARLPESVVLGAIDAPGAVSSAASTASAASPVPAAPRAAPRAGSRWRVVAAALAGAAAAVAAVAAVIALGAGGSGDGPRPSASAAIQNVALVKVFPYTGDDRVTVRAWTTAHGSDITVQCRNDRVKPTQSAGPEATYELWAVRTDGVEYKVSSWPAVYGDATFPGEVDFPVDQIKAFELRSDGKVLSTVR